MQQFPHEAKIEARIKGYPNEVPLLEEIKEKYLLWRIKRKSVKVTDNTYLSDMVKYTNEYLNIFKNPKFLKIRNNSQSKFYPSILEEAMGVFYKGLVVPPMIYGSGTIPTGISLKPFNHLKKESKIIFEECLNIEKHSADFVIGLPMHSPITKKHSIYPLVVIENKRYLDKSMARNANDTATKLKEVAPDCLYVVVSDILKGFFAKNYDPKKTKIDQIYGIRDDNDNVRIDLVSMLYEDIRSHIIHINNSVSMKERYIRGYMKDVKL